MGGFNSGRGNRGSLFDRGLFFLPGPWVASVAQVRHR